MEVVHKDELVTYSHYKAKILQLGSFIPDNRAAHKLYGTFKFINIVDLDSGATETLSNVMVYTEGAALLREGEEVEFIHGDPADKSSAAGIMAVGNGKTVRNEYDVFYADVKEGFAGADAALRIQMARYASLAMSCFFIGVVLIWLFLPTLLLWPGAVALLYFRSKIKKQRKEMKHLSTKIMSPTDFASIVSRKFSTSTHETSAA